MSIVQALANAFAPWQSLFSDSVVISTAVTTTHIVALLVGGGLAIAADRMTLRALRRQEPQWQDHLAELHAVHRPVLVMMSLVFLSGVLLATSDVKTYVAAPMFWVKLALVTSLAITGAALYRTERTLAREPAEHLRRRLGLLAKLSLTLWISTAIAGTVLTNV